MIKINGELFKFKHFNDNTLRLNYLPPFMRDLIIITWLYDNDEEMSQLYFLVNHLRENWKVELIILDMPYIPNARMDRIKNRDECFTLKYFCNFINSLNFYKVKVFDPHSYVSIALLNNVEVYYPTEEIYMLLSTYPEATLCFPDAGAMSRYSKLLDDMYFAFGVKDREWSTQEVKSLQIMGAKHMIKGHDILLCDDILSRGSTIYLAARRLKEIGANHIYVYISHCEDTVLGPHINGKSLLAPSSMIEKIYTTNSIWRAEHPDVKVIKSF